MDDNFILIGQRSTRADAVKNHDLLLETAARLFAEQGVESVSMSAVASAAGVGKGTLYRHFPSKEALCNALLDAQQRELQDKTLARLRETPCASDNLRWFLGEVALFVLRNADLLTPGSDVTLAHPAHYWWRHTIRGLLNSATQAHPSQSQPLDLDYTADVLYMMVSVQAIHFQLRALRYPSERIIDGLLTTLERLLA
jgi:AcrR family transcriptional regulator